MALLTTILVSAEDGIIRALREVSLGHNFSQALFDAIRTQAEQPFDASRHDQAIAAVYQRYPSTQALLKQAIATCIVEGRASAN